MSSPVLVKCTSNYSIQLSCGDTTNFDKSHSSMNVPIDEREFPQRFQFLPTEDSERSLPYTRRFSASTLLLITRCLLSAEFAISIGFNLVLVYTIQHGQNLSILLSIIATSNCIAAAALLCWTGQLEKASAIAAYVIWKLLQDVILVPVLVIFTALMTEGFANNVTSSTMTGCLLAIVWIYALFSIASIVFFGHVARTLWIAKVRKRRCSFASVSTVTQPLELSVESEHATTEPPAPAMREEI